MPLLTVLFLSKTLLEVVSPPNGITTELQPIAFMAAISFLSQHHNNITTELQPNAFMAAISFLFQNSHTLLPLPAFSLDRFRFFASGEMESPLFFRFFLSYGNMEIMGGKWSVND